MRRALIVVPADLKVQANNRANEVSSAGAQPTFSVPLLNTTGQIVAYWCSWACTQQEYDQLHARFGNPGFQRQDVHFYDGDVFTPDQVLSELNLVRLEEELT